jgi:hypothetical protein
MMDKYLIDYGHVARDIQHPEVRVKLTAADGQTAEVLLRSSDQRLQPPAHDRDALGGDDVSAHYMKTNHDRQQRLFANERAC